MHHSKLQVIRWGGVGGGISRTSPASAPEHNEEDSKGAKEGEDRPNNPWHAPIQDQHGIYPQTPPKEGVTSPPHHEAASPLCACAAVDLAAAIIVTNF
jgi:hypothetical protein